VNTAGGICWRVARLRMRSLVDELRAERERAATLAPNHIRREQWRNIAALLWWRARYGAGGLCRRTALSLSYSYRHQGAVSLFCWAAFYWRRAGYPLALAHLATGTSVYYTYGHRVPALQHVRL